MVCRRETGLTPLMAHWPLSLLGSCVRSPQMIQIYSATARYSEFLEEQVYPLSPRYILLSPTSHGRLVLGFKWCAAWTFNPLLLPLCVSTLYLRSASLCRPRLLSKSPLWSYRTLAPSTAVPVKPHLQASSSALLTYHPRLSPSGADLER